MSKRTALLAAGLGLAATSLLASPASAGVVSGTMVGTPNPATVGDLVTFTNSNDAASTCEGGIVYYSILDPSAVEVDSGMATPDGSGNWGASFTATSVGTWVVMADCDYNNVKELRGPTLQPFFAYNDLTVLVQAPGTTASSTSTTVASTTTSAAAAATVTPAFTG